MKCGHTGACRTERRRRRKEEGGGGEDRGGRKIGVRGMEERTVWGTEGEKSRSRSTSGVRRWQPSTEQADGESLSKRLSEEEKEGE